MATLKSQRYYIQRDIAATIIQNYWRQFLEYRTEIDDLQPQELLKKPHSPDYEMEKRLIQKKKEKLGLVEYDHKPKISNKSRKLANKRRTNMGLSNLTVEDALIQENKIMTSMREQQQFETHLKETSMSISTKRATRKQANEFFARQQQFRDRVDNKIACQRAESKSNSSDSFIGKPHINDVSKSLKRSVGDLMNWKTNAESRIQKQRDEKIKQEQQDYQMYSGKILLKNFYNFV